MTAEPPATATPLVDQRLVRPLPRLETNDWRLKAYGISHQHDEPGADLVTAARETAVRILPQTPNDERRHGAGFLIAHDGALGRWALIYWWSNNIWLHERLFHSPVDSPRLELRAVTDDLIACVYELRVVEWERQAWLRHVIDGPGDIEAYLADQLTTQPALERDSVE